MATINEKIAREIVKNDGVYPGDPQCFSVFRYYNPHFCKWDFAVAYDEGDDARYAHFEREILWRKDGNHINAGA